MNLSKIIQQLENVYPVVPGQNIIDCFSKGCHWQKLENGNKININGNRQ